MSAIEDHKGNYKLMGRFKERLLDEYINGYKVCSLLVSKHA